MKSQLRTYLDRLAANQPKLRSDHHVRRIGIFGSAARNDFTSKSDIDILVDFDVPVSLFDLVDLEDYLQRILRRKVDVVPRNAVKPAIKKNILRDIHYV